MTIALWTVDYPRHETTQCVVVVDIGTTCEGSIALTGEWEAVAVQELRRQAIAGRWRV